MPKKSQPKRKAAARSTLAGGSLSSRVYAAIAPGPFCRDCADCNGRCQNVGELCDPTEKAKEISAAVAALEADNKRLRETVAAYEDQWIEEHV